MLVTVRSKSGKYVGNELYVGRYGEIRPGKTIITQSRMYAKEIPSDDTLALRAALTLLAFVTKENPEDFVVEEISAKTA